MNSAELPDNILSKMSKADRDRLGVKTSEEAMEAFVAKSEKNLQDKMCELLDLRGIRYNQQRMDKRSTGTEGWPDITFASQGVAVAVEVKYGKHTLEEKQKECIKGMLKDGWHVFIARDVATFRWVVDHMKELGHLATPTNITPEEMAPKKKP